jgi:hypothetical protein
MQAQNLMQAQNQATGVPVRHAIIALRCLELANLWDQSNRPRAVKWYLNVWDKSASSPLLLEASKRVTVLGL